MKKIFLFVVSVICFFAMTSCGENPNDDINENLDLNEKVSLKIVGPWSSWVSMESVIDKFETKYPNVTIEYEYLQDYAKILKQRLSTNDDEVSIFVTSKIAADSEYLENALSLEDQEYLSFGDMHEGLIDNYSFTDETGKKKIYCIAYGGEIRGMYVNKTLLGKYNIEVPKNREELLAACETLKKEGIVAFQSNPADFGQQLMYPYICSLITNRNDYEEVYQMVNSADEKCVEFFEEPLKFLYDIVEAGYYNYKYVDEHVLRYPSGSGEEKSKLFFNVIENENGEYVKRDDIGVSPFVTGILSQKSAYDKTKTDYHSEIDYEFILSPVSETGGCAYMSPTQAIAINKNGSYTDWAVEFFDFFFSKEISKEFALGDNVIPNSKEAFAFIEENYHIKESNMTHLGMATFDYNFYGVLNGIMIPMTKINNPKYMIDDGNGVLTYQAFDFYKEELSKAFAEERANNG